MLNLFSLKKILKKKKSQKGVSLAEALAAITVSMLIMGAAYTIYNQFQTTFVRQINHNNLKQEARFALFSLQLDARLAGYKHPDSTEGEVIFPVKVYNDDNTEVSDDTEFGEVVHFCFDTEDASGNVTRKLISYELRKAFSSSQTKTILRKRTLEITSCDPNDTTLTQAQKDNWLPLAQYFDFFGIRLRSKHIDYELRMKTPDGNILETFTASAFMRNLNFGGKTYYAYNEEDLHENRTAVIPFTGSMKVACTNNQKLDIQLPVFTTDTEIFVLHEGEEVSEKLSATFPRIRITTVKPPEITGVPSLGHSEMRLKATMPTASNLPSWLGLTATSGWTDTDNDGSKDSNEAWDGSLLISGTIANNNSNYSFNADGYQDFVVRVKSSLDTNCQTAGWNAQNQVYKDFTLRVMKFEAPKFSDVNLHTWEPRGATFGKDNYESRGTGSHNGGPFFDTTEDGRAYYIQQNLSSPTFMVSKEQYDSFVLKGMICSGGYPDCKSEMRAWGDDDMLGFAAGLQRPNVPYKIWPDGRIRACSNVNYDVIRSNTNFSNNSLKNSLRNAESNDYNALTTHTARQDFWGTPSDRTMDMYLWSWWGAVGNASEIIVHQFKEYNRSHDWNCGLREWSWHASHNNDSRVMGWSTPTAGQLRTFNSQGYSRLFRRRDDTRPNGTGSRDCGSRGSSFSRISYLPGATHQSSCRWGRNYGVKNIVTLTYNPKKFKAIVDNKAILRAADNGRFNAFDLRFDTISNVFKLRNYLSDTFPYNVESSPANVTLPSSSQSPTPRDDLLEANFKRFQKGSIGLASYSQPDNRYSNIQIARLPRFVPDEDDGNKPMAKSQDLFYYMDEDFLSINKIYGLLSKSYDPVGRHLEVLTEAISSANCAQVGSRGTADFSSGGYKQQTVGGALRTMNCRLSGNWRADTEQWANNTELPNIGELYDTNNKSNYSGARSRITTTEGGTIEVFADGSFQYVTLPTGFTNDGAKKDSFYYAVQTEDSSNSRISNIHKVYIGWKIANTTPSGVSFREDGAAEDAAAITLTNVDIAEDDKRDKVVAELFVSSSNEPDTNDFVRFNLGLVPNNDSDKDVDHGSRFRIDQIGERFYLVLNDHSDIRWGDLPDNKKYFSVRIIGTDLRGNQLRTTQKVYVDRVDCSETAMEGIQIYKTKAAMTLEGYIVSEDGERVYRRQTVPLTNALDEAVITYNYSARNVQPSVRVKEETVTVGGEQVTIGMLSNRCKESHSYINREQLWSND